MVDATPAKRVNWIRIELVKEKSVLYSKRTVSSPKDAVILVKDMLESSDKEKLIVCSLNTKNEPTALEVVSIGTLNSSLVHPREVFKSSILNNANSIIVFHNHPSGEITPSNEDINITKRLQESGKILGIELIDHIIIGQDNYCSLKEKGIL